MKQNWTYRDVFDLEYFCHQDSDKDPTALHRRDRTIFLATAGKTGGEEPKRLLHRWLQARRLEEFSARNAKSPGRMIQDGAGLLQMLLPVLGLLCGLGSGLGFFTYTGTTPVNVFHFLVLFVFSQLVLLVVLAAAASLRLTRLLPALPSAMVQLYGTACTSFTVWLQRRVLRSLPAARRCSFDQALGLTKKAGRRYGLLLYWPLFTLSQLVFVALNMGLLAATLFRVATSDIAFGWQSTIQFSGAAIHEAVRLLALPWSWLVPEQYAHPSLSAIEGSRIVLKDGIYHLATQDLVSWWPFLVLCLLVYGLFCRFLLFLAGLFLQYRALKNLEPRSPDCLRVLQRMRSPLVTTQAPPSPQRSRAAADRPSHAATGVPPGSAVTGFRLTVLVPADISAQCSSDRLDPLLRHHGFSGERYEFITGDFDADRLILNKLGASTWPPDGGVLVVAEAWLPPIGDFLSFLGELRAALGPETPLFIGLIGRSQRGRPLCPADPADSRIWRQKTDSLGDPSLQVIGLVGRPDPIAEAQ